MKTANIIKVADGYEVVLELDEETPSGKVIYQASKEKGLNEVVDTLKLFYGGDENAKRNVRAKESGMGNNPKSQPDNDTDLKD